MRKKKIKRVTYAVAATMLGAAMPIAGIVAPSVMTVANAADPETHHVKQGTRDGYMYTYSTIDTTKKGSIQIYKYEENDGYMQEGTGFKDESATKTRDGKPRRPIQGVQFKGVKIADVVGVAGNDTVGTYYTNLNPLFTNLLQAYGLTQIPKTKDFGNGADSDKNGKYYTTESIESALKALNEAPVPANSSDGADNEKPGHKGTERAWSGVQAVNNAVNEANGATDFGYTDDDGYCKSENLPLGLYLIAETDYKPDAILNKEHVSADQDPSGAKYEKSTKGKGGQNVTGDDSQNHQDVEVSTDPYLVSVPMTNVISFQDDNQNPVDAGTVWFYDITTYPKNQTTNITKKIIDPDTKDDKKLEDYEDYSIGDTVKQMIYADAPANMELGEVDTDNNQSGKSTRAVKEPNKYSIYSLSDVMEKGLQYDGVTRVCYGPKIAPTKEQDFDKFTDLEKDVDYRIIKEPIRINPMTNESFDANQNRLDQTLASAEKPTDTEFCVQLTSKGIAKLNALKTDSQVAVFFDSQVTPSAKIGTDPKNTNQARLTTKHEYTSTFEKYSNETRVYTFEINGLKVAQDNSKDEFDPAKSSFTVKQTKHEGDGWASKDRTRDATKNIQLTNDVKIGKNKLDTDWDDTDFVKFIKEEDGIYHVYADKTDDASKVTTIINPSHEGKIVMKGLDSAKYTITERGTQDHYALQKASFDIDLTAKSQTDAKDYRSEKVLDRLAKNALVTEHLNGELATAKITADGTSSYLTLTDSNKGICNLKIINDNPVTLRTGGKGVTGIYIAAIGSGAAVMAAYVIHRRRNSGNE